MSRGDLMARLDVRAALRPRGRDGGELAATLPMLRVLLGFESSLYAAVTPVLPHYAHTLHAGKPAVGLLAAAYAIGIIPGSLIGGWAASRAGVRRTTISGLIAFAVTAAAFGFTNDLVLLDLLRIAQGAASGLIWGGGLAWAIAVAPRERRGAIIGSVIGAAILGTLAGPLLGVGAVSLGTGPVFSAVGVAALVLAAWVARHCSPSPASPEPAPSAGALTEPSPSAAAMVPDPSAEPATAPRGRPVSRRLTASGGLWLGAWLVCFDAMSTGAISALLPLRLSAQGASSVIIGAVFLLASAVATLVAPVVGRASDRHGPSRPMSVGLIAGALLFALLPVPAVWPLLAALTVIVMSGPLSAFMIPAVPMMTASAERIGISVVVATTLVNLAYAIGETVGAPGGALLSSAGGDVVPFLVLAGLMLVTLVLVRRHRACAAVTAAQAVGPPPPAGEQPAEPGHLRRPRPVTWPRREGRRSRPLLRRR
ncbi:MAG TPA: MFS transporter [Solirubrobacteraceae bacterium]|nr:MFS transporter [Solirubrobacteraceae bacterium]